jgi:hypothetical protein
MSAEVLIFKITENYVIFDFPPLHVLETMPPPSETTKLAYKTRSKSMHPGCRPH